MAPGAAPPPRLVPVSASVSVGGSSSNDHRAHPNQRHHPQWVMIPPRRVECGPEGRSAWVVAGLAGTSSNLHRRSTPGRHTVDFEGESQVLHHSVERRRRERLHGRERSEPRWVQAMIPLREVRAGSLGHIVPFRHGRAARSRGTGRTPALLLSAGATSPRQSPPERSSPDPARSAVPDPDPDSGSGVF